MAKEICISTTPHETRLAILEDDQLTEVYYERENEYTLAGSVYKGRVTRVLPGMQSSFVDIGLERDAFLYVTDFLEEQEDSEEYETSSGAPQGRGRRGGEERGAEPEGGRREGRRREGREPREPKASEPVREQVISLEAAPVASPEEGESEEGMPEGTRRWRGRRRRRGGVRAAALGTPEANAASEQAEGLPATPERGAPGGMAPPSIELKAEIEESRVDLQASAAPERRGRSRSSENRPAAGGSAITGNVPAMTLPGEQITKYGGKPVAAVEPAAKAVVTKAVNYSLPRPATETTVGEGWDGGAVLPGESLARHRKAAASEENNDAALETPVAETRIETPAEVTAAPEIASAPVESAPEIVAESLPGTPDTEQLATSSEPVAEAQTEAAVAEFAADEAAAEANVRETVIPETAQEEFEPEDGSAGVRLTPPTSQELRFRSRKSAEKAAAEAAALEVAPAEAATVVEPVQPEKAVSLEATAPVIEPAFEAVEITTEEAEFVAVDQPDVDAATEHLSERGTDGFAEMVDQLHGFAPGAGLVEEEVIDEEEYEFEPIHAHADEHDLEDLEEETLEGQHDGPISESFAMEPEENEAAGEDFEEAPAAPATEGRPASFYFESADEEDEESEPGEPTAQPAPRRGGEERGRRGRNGRGRNGERNGGRRQNGHGHGQNHSLPVISDLLKEGQEILVQIAKEPIAKKGARITSHIALPGRFLVFMPTVNHVGVSRKIASDEERQRLKRILISEKGDNSGGFIVRTAADGASEEELRADLRFLINLWAEIKGRADNSKAPALIYHDLNLVERILRDQVSSNFSAIWVDTEQEYERIVRFLNRFQPSLVRRVKLYVKETPLFEHFGIQDEISKALKSKVWLKSGGSIVINQTEALVAIDINTGKYVGKTSRLEDTIVKTNLDAIPEIVRQIRLRDLGGIIVIDFIDMDERKNRQKVLQALEEALKADRAPSKVLQFNDFGLVAITRKRVKQSLERTLSVPCAICTGTGMVKSPSTVCNEIYIELRKMQKHLDGKDVMLRVNPEVVKQLKASNGRWINDYEEMIGKTIIIKSDPSLHPEQFDIH